MWSPGIQRPKEPFRWDRDQPPPCPPPGPPRTNGIRMGGCLQNRRNPTPSLDPTGRECPGNEPPRPTPMGVWGRPGGGGGGTGEAAEDGICGRWAVDGKRGPLRRRVGGQRGRADLRGRGPPPQQMIAAVVSWMSKAGRFWSKECHGFPKDLRLLRSCRVYRLWGGTRGGEGTAQRRRIERRWGGNHRPRGRTRGNAVTTPVRPEAHRWEEWVHWRIAGEGSVAPIWGRGFAPWGRGCGGGGDNTNKDRRNHDQGRDGMGGVLAERCTWSGCLPLGGRVGCVSMTNAFM